MTAHTLDPEPGFLFWAQHPKSPKEHPYVVLTPPGLSDGLMVVVNLTANDGRKTNTCVIDPTDDPHGRITKSSVVYYAETKMVPIVPFRQGMAKGLVRPAPPPFDGGLLDRILRGVMTDPDIPGKFREPVAQAHPRLFPGR